MNILVLSKRQYMGKDLLDDQYGRFYEIPECLASRGHMLIGLCLSYRNRDERLFVEGALEQNTATWHSVNLSRLPPRGFLRYLAELDKIIESFKPAVIYGCSDSMHAIIARYAAKRHNIKLVIDLYDNFESYGATKIPGITRNFTNSLRNADGVTVVSERLRRYVTAEYGLHQPVSVLGNAVNKDLFTPLEKAKSRKQLGLPENAILIGTAGALYKNRDIGTLFAAYDSLRADNSHLQLVLAGPRGKGVVLPTGDDIHDLGMLEHREVAIMYSALDIGVICNIDSAFGRYCYPQKFFEMLSCRTPIIAASVGTLEDILAEEFPYAVYQPGKPDTLASGVHNLLANPQVPNLPTPGWSDRAGELELFFNQIA